MTPELLVISLAVLGFGIFVIISDRRSSRKHKKP